MNPIETCGNYLKIIELYIEPLVMRGNATTQAHLIQAAKEAWLLLGEDLLNSITEGMQKRIDALKAAKSAVY